MAPANIGIGWRLSSVSGWGVYGLNLTLQLLNKGRTPVLYLEPHLLSVDDQTAARLAPILNRQRNLTDVLQKGTAGDLELEFPVLFALRNGIAPGLAEQPLSGAKNIASSFSKTPRSARMRSTAPPVTISSSPARAGTRRSWRPGASTT